MPILHTAYLYIPYIFGHDVSIYPKTLANSTCLSGDVCFQVPNNVNSDQSDLG